MNIVDIENTIIKFYGKDFDEYRWEQYQKPVMEKILEENSNVLGLMPTGSGKSFLFQFFAAFNPDDGITIVIEPLQSIIEDQVNRFNNEFNEERAGKADSIYRTKINKDILFLSPEQLYVCANRMLEHIKKKTKIQMIVIDEVHTLLDWGTSFRSEFLYIPAFIELVKKYNPNLKVLSLTATMNNSEIDLCKKCFGGSSYLVDRREETKDENNPAPKFVSVEGKISNAFASMAEELSSREALYTLRKSQIVFFKEYNSIDNYLKFLCKNEKKPYFIEQSDQSKYLYQREIKKSGHKINTLIGVFRGDLPIEDKQFLLDVIERAQRDTRYRTGAYRCYMLATKALAMGVDLNSISGVKLVGIPESWNYYLQEIGRIRKVDKYSSTEVVVYYSSLDAISMLKKIRNQSERNVFVSVIERIKLWNYLCFWEWVLDSIKNHVSCAPKDIDLSLDKLLAKRPIDVRRKLETVVKKDPRIKKEDIDINRYDALFKPIIKANDMRIEPLIALNISKGFLSLDKYKYPGIFNGGSGRLIVDHDEVGGETSCIISLNNCNQLNFFDYLVFNAVYTHHMYSVEGVSNRTLLRILLGNECYEEDLLKMVDKSLDRIKSTKVRVHYTDGFRIDEECALYENDAFPIFKVVPELEKDITAIDTGKIRNLFDSIKSKRKYYTVVNTIAVYYSLFGIERHNKIFRIMAEKERNYNRLRIPYSIPSINNALEEWLNLNNTGYLKNKNQEIARLKKKMQMILVLEYDREYRSSNNSIITNSIEEAYDTITQMAYGVKISKYSEHNSRYNKYQIRKFKEKTEEQRKKMEEDKKDYLISYIPKSYTRKD